MELDSLRPIISGLLGGFVVYLLSCSGRSPAPRSGNRRRLSYGLGFRVFAAILVPGSLFVAYAASQARSSQLIIAVAIATTFLVAAAFFAYQVFFVSFEYDDQNIYYRSLLAGSHVIPWTEVLEVGYSGLLQASYLRTKQVRRIWCSNMLRGFDELGEFLSKKYDELYGSPNKSQERTE